MLKKCLCWVGLLTIMGGCLGATVWGAQNPEAQGRAYFDFGLFAYEEGDFQDAAANLEKALPLMPRDPYLHQYLGKSYLELKDFEAARRHLEEAARIDPRIADLTYDLGMLAFQTESYGEALDRFDRVLQEEPDHILARYYAAISLYKLERFGEAGPYFEKAADASPSITANGSYYAGLCYYKTDSLERAREMFTRVADSPDAGPLAESAAEWLKAIRNREKADRPLNLYLKAGRRYDDNVQLEPSDLDIATDESDWATLLFFDGLYTQKLPGNWSVGGGYSHYQTWYDDLDAFDTIGALPTLFAQYRWQPLTFRLSYRPTYYWVDSDSYLREHRIEPEVRWRLSDQILMRLRYRYDDKTYFDFDSLSGHSNEFYLDGFYAIAGGTCRLYGGIGYEDYSATAVEQHYGRMNLRAGAVMQLPWELELGMHGEYQDKKYDETDPFFGAERDDDKFIGAVSLSRTLFYDWLGIMAEYRYTRNDSNIKTFDYTRNLTTISITASY